MLLMLPMGLAGGFCPAVWAWGSALAVPRKRVAESNAAKRMQRRPFFLPINRENSITVLLRYPLSALESSLVAAQFLGFLPPI
jgi:hypothetical protein